MSRAVVIFLLIASFGILMVGCTRQQQQSAFEEFTFTDKDLERIQTAISSDAATVTSVLTESGAQPLASGTAILDVVQAGMSSSSLAATQVTLDASKQKYYDSLRMGVGRGQDDNVYRVNNPFVNVRQSMSVGSALVERLEKGAVMTVLDISSAEWAKVRLVDGKEGYVSLRYIAKVVSEQQLAQEKKQYEGKYFVNFAFLNIRKDPSAQAEKIGELPGQAIVKPLSINGEWARVAFNGREGYVSSKYLEPFRPVFLVRQDDYKLSILHFRATDDGILPALAKDIAALKAAGKHIVTLGALRDLVIAQETRDARIQPGTVVLAISGITAKTAKQVADTLTANGVSATLFITTRDIGMQGITEKMMINLVANGNDVQSAGHSGDDLRAMTDEQITLELYQSKKLIEDLTHKEVYAIFYPTGGVNDRVMKKVSQVGYLFGVGQSPDQQFSRDQFLRLPSLYISSAMTTQDVVKLAK